MVIPNYNYGHYLAACADSVLSQTGVAVRLLIIDNASVDESASVARALAARDPRVEIVLRSRNAGPHASFNEGIDWARSDCFLILCADDLLAPGALLRAARLLEKRPDVHLTCGAICTIPATLTHLPQSGTRQQESWQIHTGGNFIRHLCKHAFNPVAGPTAVVRTAIQKKAGYYRATLSHTDDLEMWLRLALLGNIASTAHLQAFSRVHSENQSATVAGILNWNREFEAGFTSFFDHEGSFMSDARQHRLAVRACLSKRAYWSALSKLVRHEAGFAALMGFALRRHPAMALIPPVDYLMQRFRRPLPEIPT